jgi:hypothetical protein
MEHRQERQAEMMARQTRNIAMLFTAAGVILLGMTLATAAARAGQGSGTVAAIEPAARTVVIELSQGKETFTVIGPLSPKAVVKKGGKTAQLDDVHVGDQVRVTWHHTVQGHEIAYLEAR